MSCSLQAILASLPGARIIALEAFFTKFPSIVGECEMAIVVMESVLGKVTVAVNGDGVVQLLSIGEKYFGVIMCLEFIW